MLNSSASKGWFSGIPSVIEYGDAIIEHGPELVTEAIDHTLKDRTRKIREQAQHDRVWAPYAQNISVTYDERTQEIVFSVEGSPRVVRGAKEAEYGTGRTPPTGFLRKQAAHAYDLEAEVNRYIGQVMG